MCIHLRSLTLGLFLAGFLSLFAPVPAASSESGSASGARPLLTARDRFQVPSKLILTAEANGHYDLYGWASQGEPQRLVRDASPMRAPALASDGRVAYQSRRDGNWEIYVSALDGSNRRRVTNTLDYDGAPAWSPDGARLAFESYRTGNLNVWVMNADGSNPVDLTPNPAAQFGPAWSPDGRWIAYTSWETGNKQLFLVSPDGGPAMNLSGTKSGDEQPAWSPDGKQLSFVSNRDGQKAVYLADFVGGAKPQLANVRRVTFFGWDFAPAFSPDGQWLAFLSTRPGRQTIYVLPLGGASGVRVPRPIGDGAWWITSFAWTNRALPKVDPGPEDPPLYVEQPIRADPASGHPYAAQNVKPIYLAPSYGNMSSRVATSLLALRDRARLETGYDFLGTLSDMMRQMIYPCDADCEILSWHKTGRAVDTLLEYAQGGVTIMETAREDQVGELYWRMYLRAARQDGTQGEPLKDAMWDFSYDARWVATNGEGGVEKPLLSGYYVDFTELARQYGWTRIPSADDPDFDWRSNKLAVEYWHYEKRDGLSWYAAMREVFSASDLLANFDWVKMVQTRQEPERKLYFKEMPPPPSAWKWYVVMPPGSP